MTFAAIDENQDAIATAKTDPIEAGNLADNLGSSSNSSRRRKGKPKKCISTIANGTPSSLPNCSSSSLSAPESASSAESSSATLATDDSGLGSSFGSVLASILPSTSLADAEPLILPMNLESLSASQQQQLLTHLDTSQLQLLINSCNAADKNGICETEASSSMIPPASSAALLASSALRPSFSPSPSNSLSSASVPSHPSANGCSRKKKVRRAEEVGPVSLPPGFDQILEKARTTDSADFLFANRPLSAGSAFDPASNGSPAKKRREVGRCETKATIQGPDGSILEEKYDAEELQNFVKQFKVLRNKYGFTQGDVGVALGRRYGADFSQTTISRFEALNLSFKNMCKLRPLLEEWLDEIEKALERGVPISELLQNHGICASATANGQLCSTATPSDFDQSGSNSPESGRPMPVPVPKLNAKIVPPLKKRRKRTNLDPQQKMALDAFFQMNARPDYGQIQEIGKNLGLDNDVIRVWFCNKRQKLRKCE